MKITIVFSMCMGLLTTQVVADQLATEPVKMGKSIECTVVEVATQYESASSSSEFQCIVDPGNAAGLEAGLYELNGLPRDFEQKFRGELMSGETQLEASNIYRLQRKLIFTTDTVWSLIQISGETKHPARLLPGN